MHHLKQLYNNECLTENALVKRASGRYYTGSAVGQQLCDSVADLISKRFQAAETISVIDPFGGDGRLASWLLESYQKLNLPPINWKIQLWDISDIGFQTAADNLDLQKKSGINLEYDLLVTDAFLKTSAHAGDFDIVITNPPWEILKPDRREISSLSKEAKAQYIEAMRSYDERLSKLFPCSQPKRKFAGWGTNLSRVGLDISLKLSRANGIVGIVLPASLLADDQSVLLRKNLITQNTLHSLTYYPAELKHYEGADVASVTMALETSGRMSDSIVISTQTSDGGGFTKSLVPLDSTTLEARGYSLPISFGTKAIQLLDKLKSIHPTWEALEKNPSSFFWAGRELDETGSAQWLKPLNDSESPPFLKGRMITRYRIIENPAHFVDKPKWHPPASVAFHRIAWRDVSRPNQLRRMIATIVPPGWALGNSLGVAFFKNDNIEALESLLGIINSTSFELQLRSNLATGHVSLSSLRKVSIPSLENLLRHEKLNALVKLALKKDTESEIEADAYVASHIYQLSYAEYRLLLDQFEKLESDEKTKYLSAYCKINGVPFESTT